MSLLVGRLRRLGKLQRAGSLARFMRPGRGKDGALHGHLIVVPAARGFHLTRDALARDWALTIGNPASIDVQAINSEQAFRRVASYMFADEGLLDTASASGGEAVAVARGVARQVAWPDGEDAASGANPRCQPGGDDSLLWVGPGAAAGDAHCGTAGRCAHDCGPAGCGGPDGCPRRIGHGGWPEEFGFPGLAKIKHYVESYGVTAEQVEQVSLSLSDEDH